MIRLLPSRGLSHIRPVKSSVSASILPHHASRKLATVVEPVQKVMSSV